MLWQSIPWKTPAQNAGCGFTGALLVATCLTIPCWKKKVTLNSDWEYQEFSSQRPQTTERRFWGHLAAQNRESWVARFPESWGFPKGGFCEGGKSQQLGRLRAPVAIINFAFFVRELLVESYINSEIFTGIWREINCCNRCARDPNYWDLPPSQKPPFGIAGQEWAEFPQSRIAEIQFRIANPNRTY